MDLTLIEKKKKIVKKFILLHEMSNFTNLVMAN